MDSVTDQMQGLAVTYQLYGQAGRKTVNEIWPENATKLLIGEKTECINRTYQQNTLNKHTDQQTKNPTYPPILQQAAVT